MSMMEKACTVVVVLAVLALLVLLIVTCGCGEGFTPYPAGGFTTPADLSSLIYRDGDGPVEYDGDWSETIKEMALDQDVVESHQEFLADPNRWNSTLRNETIMDHDNRSDWVGLRRPNYAIPIGPGARQVPGEYVYQLPRKNTFCL
jgi:hypothetical protein